MVYTMISGIIDHLHTKLDDVINKATFKCLKETISKRNTIKHMLRAVTKNVYQEFIQCESFKRNLMMQCKECGISFVTIMRYVKEHHGLVNAIDQLRNYTPEDKLFFTLVGPSTVSKRVFIHHLGTHEFQRQQGDSKRVS